jgi:predicted transcriptional regulator
LISSYLRAPHDLGFVSDRNGPIVKKFRTLTDAMTDNNTDADLLSLTAKIVSAHVSNNSVDASALASLIQLVHKTLAGIGEEEVPVEKLVPAVPIKKSVFPDFIVCLEDGKKLKMLKRHLATSYNMTPEQYRERWSLPSDYPMVAPDYAAKRSQLAKSIGLGRKPAPPVEVEVVAAKRGRKTASAE